MTAKGKRRNGLILSIVAILEVIAIAVVATSAWVENISAIKIWGDGVFENALYTTAKIGSGAGYSGDLDLSKYFRSSGGIHLGAASSANGKDVYFPITASEVGDTLDPYRKATVHDKNVNYYSYSFKVQSVTSKCNFFFFAVPTIEIDGVAVPSYTAGDTEEVMAEKHRIRNAVRIAISAGSAEPRVFSMDDFTENVVSSSSGNVSSSRVRAFSSFLTGTIGSESLFTIDQGQEKTVRVTMWLQDTERNGTTFAGKTISVSGLKLAAGLSTVTFKDYTSKYNVAGATTWKWATDPNYPMFVYDGSKSYSMSLSGTDEWKAQVLTSVLDDNTKTLYFCRCQTGTTTISNQNDSAVLQRWTATVADMQSASTTTYKAYGNANGATGRGTWGNVQEITLVSRHSALPTPTSGAEDSAAHVLLTSNVTSSVQSEMNYNEGMWRCYLPTNDSANVTFSFGNNTVNAGARGGSTQFFITSASTGYWAPPATVRVRYADGSSSTCGTIKVTGGVENSQDVDVTAGTNVTLIAVANEGYRFVGWSLNQNGSSPNLTSANQSVTAPAQEQTATYYAVFIKTYNISFKVVTDDDDTDTAGGTVNIDNGTAVASVTKTVDTGSTVTLTATANSGFTLSGIYDITDDQNEVDLGSSPATDTVTQDKEYVARFVSQPLASSYYLKGSFNEWQDDDQMYYVNNVSSSNKVYVTKELTPNTYSFKIHHYVSGTTDTWYTNSTTFGETFVDQNFNTTTGASETNANITIATTGYYTFVFDISSSGSEKLSVFYQRTETLPTTSNRHDELMFNTSTAVGSAWLWQRENSTDDISSISGAVYNTTKHELSNSNTIATLSLLGKQNTYVRPAAIGLQGTYTDGAGYPDNATKVTLDVDYDTSKTYTDNVFYTDADTSSNANWKVFDHIGGTVSLNVSRPRPSNMITLSTTNTVGTLKSGAKVNYYVKKGNDVYHVGKADSSTVTWMPMESGNYEVYVVITDKWGLETTVSEAVSVRVR